MSTLLPSMDAPSFRFSGGAYVEGRPTVADCEGLLARDGALRQLVVDPADRSTWSLLIEDARARGSIELEGRKSAATPDALLDAAEGGEQLIVRIDAGAVVLSCPWVSMDLVQLSFEPGPVLASEPALTALLAYAEELGSRSGRVVAMTEALFSEQARLAWVPSRASWWVAGPERR
ncbi:MAG: hypothetical protein M3Y87_04420 [Myxococcota bacterium]|nr:hypothetical protein [Myxococcota bacterium]